MGEASREVEQVVHVALKEAQWRQLIIRSLKGESDKELAQAFGVQVGTIRQRRYSDPVWGAAQEQIKAAQKLLPKAALTDSKTPLSLQEIASASPESVARFAHNLLESSIEQGLIPAPTSISEFKMLVEIIRKSCGLDNASAQISVSLWSGQAPDQTSGPSVIMEAEVIQPKTDVDWV